MAGKAHCLPMLLTTLALLTACSQAESLEAQVADPKVGDVYVVEFRPQGAKDRRYYFYKLFRVTPDSAYLHPARVDAPSSDAALPGVFVEEKSLPYTRKELLELLNEQPGDVLKTKLVRVRREP